jgi:hypothetical protein
MCRFTHLASRQTRHPDFCSLSTGRNSPQIIQPVVWQVRRWRHRLRCAPSYTNAPSLRAQLEHVGLEALEVVTRRAAPRLGRKLGGRGGRARHSGRTASNESANDGRTAACGTCSVTRCDCHASCTCLLVRPMSVTVVEIFLLEIFALCRLLPLPLRFATSPRSCAASCSSARRPRACHAHPIPLQRPWRSAG